MIKVLLVDDHEVVRMGLRALLETEDDIEAVGEAESGAAALRFIAEHSVDVAVVDIAMPDLNGLELLKLMTADFPQIKVIMLSMHSAAGYVLEALQAGAVGYVLKDTGGSDVILAVRSAMTGARYLSLPVSEQMIDGYVQTARPGLADKTALTLTDREQEVLRLSAMGATKPQISEELRIRVRTVETHRSNAMRKLGLRGQVDLVRYGIQSGLVPMDTDPNTYPRK